MPEASDAIAREEHSLLEDWSLRPLVLGILLGVCGLGIHLLTDDYFGYSPEGEHSPFRLACAAFLFFGGIALAFTLSVKKAVEAAIFSAIIGLILGGITYHITGTEERYAGVEFTFFAGVFFWLLSVPLFQAGFHATRMGTDYKLTHFHCWADGVSGGAALAFMGLTIPLLYLLDGLLGIVGIDFIGDLLNEESFVWVWCGLTFGAALGIIRNNLKVIGALQKVVMLVFALLAVPFAIAIAVFLIALLASGGAALWEASDSATPILLCCAAACFVLYNAIIRDSDEERSGSKIMQITAAVLAACILPLSIFAAISMGIRIDQYGLAPERIWGSLAIIVACAYGLGAWIALGLGRMAGWSALLRRATFMLALGVCGLALALSLPFWDFGAISAKSQLARLESGAVSEEGFDFDALRWDFGEAGRDALASLTEGEGETARLAKEAQERDSRPWRGREEREDEVLEKLEFAFDDPEKRRIVIEVAREDYYYCNRACKAFLLAENGENARFAVLQGGQSIKLIDLETEREVLRKYLSGNTDEEPKVEIREVTERFLFIDGEMVEEPIDVRLERLSKDDVAETGARDAGPIPAN